MQFNYPKTKPLFERLMILLLSAAGVLAYGHNASADGSVVSQPSGERPTSRQYSDRLPPLLPGEEVVTETGQKIKTWTSAGPVPVNRRPTPQGVGNGNGVGGVGVIVDGRERHGHDHHLRSGGGELRPLGGQGR